MAPTSSITTPFLCPNVIYKQLTPAAIHRINPPVTIPNLYLVPALYLISTIYKNKVTTDVL